ncbi:NitT/TauT family transport system permease protein [Haloactinopolyspora alba]|uniref:NitT/TauT family transport system permease protein n=1 Tax=Haloactinopolyspora alba TaxID=648780 RepID=A0A2P8DV51_9ACTN|nr:ABC transporter permease [Haloactinopolyspora alba]PSL01074.1 NitT/TauT family transport system permease protein [Haloactinopolyspora alba]
MTSDVSSRDGLTDQDRPAGAGVDGPDAGEELPTPAARNAVLRWTLQAFSAVWRPGLLLILLGVGWWVVTAAEMFPAYLVPTPGDVWATLLEDREMLATHTWVTTYETVVGFLLAALIGMVAAVLIVYSPTLEKALYPLILFAQVIPKIAIAPILVVWFGFGPTPKIILAVLIAFFPVVVSGVAGLRSTDPALLDLSSTMGASRWQTFRKIRFPGALPHLLSGLKVAVTLAVVGAVVGEFVGADEGLGYVLLLASGNLNSSLLFADLILMSALGVALFVLVEAAEALLIPWHASRRQAIPMTTTS